MTAGNGHVDDAASVPSTTTAEATTGSRVGDAMEENEDLRVEVVNVDYYLSAPLPQGALAKLPASPCYLQARHVPVVRVFGATPAGQKACVHIHGLFPYFYFRAEDDPAFNDPEQLRRLLPRIALELEKANALKQQQQQRNRSSGNAPVAAVANSSAANSTSNSTENEVSTPTRPRRSVAAKLVAKLLIVQGTPFYGYHAGPRLFVQIFLYNPRTVSAVVQLLESGCIAERVFQPYEAHIPFLLQVFADYNIEGMNSIHLSNAMFRAPLPSSQDHLAAAAADHEDLCVFLRSNVPSSRINGDSQAVAQIVKGRHVRVPEIAPRWFDRQSLCALEVDVAAECILNPRIARSLQAAMTASGELRNVPSLAALWEEERRRRIQNGEQSSPEFSLSVDRNVGATPQVSANVAQSAASSLLSQSFFRQKMETATATIIEKLLKDLEKKPSEGESPASGSSLSMDDVALAGSSMSINASDSDVSTVQHNTIATESAFSFSQVEHDATGRDETDHEQAQAPSEHEDQAIIDLLISMQRTTEQQWQTQVQLAHDDRDDLSAASEAEESDVDEAAGDGGRLDEIGDILASQHPQALNKEPGEAHANGANQHEPQAWWDVIQDQAKLSSSSSVLDLGSPRVDLDSTTPIRRPPTSRRTRRRIELHTSGVSPSNEDSEDVPDMENLLPPPPPPRSRSLKAPVDESDEEDSVPFDPLIVSLTPQPQRRRTNSPATQASPGRLSFSPGQPRGSAGRKVWIFEPKPPSMAELLDSSKPFGIEAMEHIPAFYSAANDIPDKPLIFSGKKFDFTPVDLAHTSRFNTLDLRRKLRPTAEATSGVVMYALLSHDREHGSVRRIRTPVRPPRTVADVSKWCETARDVQPPSTFSQRRRKRARVMDPLTTSLDHKRLSPSAINSNLTVMSVEVHANSRGGMLPDPRLDRVEVLCYAVDAQEGPTDEKAKARGVILCKPDEFAGAEDLGFCIDDGELTFTFARDERELISKFEELVRQWDPDFLAGLEVQKESIGYLVDRASQLKVNLIQTLSRLPTTMVDARNLGAMQGPEDEMDGEESADVSIGTTWGVTKASGLWIHGRFILNIWRLARSEAKLARHSREYIVRAVLKREFPTYTAEQLTSWYNKGGVLRWKTIRYTVEKVKCNLQLLSRIQLITRTSEMARLFGMDFYSVLSRGSQYRVESMMLRLTKRHNYLMVSPNRPQVARQAAMECIPLVMEPQSGFYSDPVVVLDFQSLYPSLVIGYNLCFSTMFGRLRDGLHADLETSLGVMDFMPSAEGLVRDRESLITIPNGVLISSKAHRLGVLPVILDEILSTRIMVKNAMKAAKKRNDERLEKVLNARQLALKLLANVTYGYTAAGFSGRMPCAQLADAIVQSGRCTLEAALRLVEGHASWNAKVVYGDTDSLFVLLRGRSKDDAFRIGQEIADAVTATNPKPVTLKLEKVYMGCILVSKKRYVGLKYESLDQPEGVLESKGIEIVRRDSCGVVQHAMQRCLELLFSTGDLSLVKKSLEEFWLRMLDDQVPLDDFVFAKEVRLGTYARGSAPPAALVSAKAMAKDPRAEPRYAERVPYVVVNGPPGARLMDLVVSPTEFLDRRRGAALSINYQYYIQKQMIPSLERLFLLMGANVRLWFTQLPRVAGKARTAAAMSSSRGMTKKSLLAETRSIDSFYMSKHCRLCGTMGQNVLCRDCESNPQRSEFVRQVLAARRERSLETLRLICTGCGGRDAMETCRNVSCGVWNRIRLVENGREQDEFEVKW